MARVSDSEDEDSHPQASSSKSKTIYGLLHLPNAREGDSFNVWPTDNQNPLAGFEFDKLPTELLVEIFRHARADSLYDAHNEKYRYPVALSHVCRHWRTVTIAAPTLWSDIRVLEYHREAREATCIYLERSKTCPIYFTWFTEPGQLHNDAPAVVEHVIIPAAERWERITLIAGTKIVSDSFLTAIQSLDFPILRGIEISCVPSMELFPPTSTLCHSTPLLRRCRFRNFSSLPSLPSNLVVLDCVFLALGSTVFDLDPFLQFLPHVAHSLEHLRFEPPSTSGIHFTPGTPKIPLENLKSLLIADSHAIMNHILAPNLTSFVAYHSFEADAKEAAQMFEGFSAPKLRSIQFHQSPLLPLLATHNLPSMFPQLESVLLSSCTDESAFVPLLADTFSHLKELTISDMTIWTSLQAAIEKRFKNGDKSLRKIQLPKGDATVVITPHLRQWLPAQGIELVLYEPGELPRSTPEFQDEPFDEEDRLFLEITMRGSEWGDVEDYDFDLWEAGVMSYLNYEDPSFDDEEGYEGEFHEG